MIPTYYNWSASPPRQSDLRTTLKRKSNSSKGIGQELLTCGSLRVKFDMCVISACSISVCFICVCENSKMWHGAFPGRIWCSFCGLCFASFSDVKLCVVFSLDFRPVSISVCEKEVEWQLAYWVFGLYGTPGCEVGVWQWPKRGERIGEASNPGPTVACNCILMKRTLMRC